MHLCFFWVNMSVIGRESNLRTHLTERSARTPPARKAINHRYRWSRWCFKGDAPASLLRRDESGLPFVQRLHLIVDPDAFVTAGGTLTANPSTIEDVSSALQTVDVPSEPKLWKALNPYHGLKALREQDADFLVRTQRRHRPVHLCNCAGTGSTSSRSRCIRGREKLTDIRWRICGDGTTRPS